VYTSLAASVAPLLHRRRTPEQRLDARQQFHHLKGFGQVIVRADLQADDFVNDLPARRQHENGHARPALP
jgi:hypothetical protein